MPALSAENLCVSCLIYLERKDAATIKLLSGKKATFFPKLKHKDKLAQRKAYKGIFPCFFLGRFATLFSSIAKALMSFLRVSLGSITSSIYPRSAAW